MTRLRLIRHAKGLSQKNMARLLGINNIDYQKLENGAYARPTRFLLQSLHKYFGANWTFEELMAEVNEADVVKPARAQKMKRIGAKRSDTKECSSLDQEDERMPPEAPGLDGKIHRGPNGGPSHKQAGSRERQTIVLDDAILSLFEQERLSRGLTKSKLASIILWNRYGCPKLSFE